MTGLVVPSTNTLPSDGHYFRARRRAVKPIVKSGISWNIHMHIAREAWNFSDGRSVPSVDVQSPRKITMSILGDCHNVPKIPLSKMSPEWDHHFFFRNVVSAATRTCKSQKIKILDIVVRQRWAQNAISEIHYCKLSSCISQRYLRHNIFRGFEIFFPANTANTERTFE